MSWFILVIAVVELLYGLQAVGIVKKRRFLRRHSTAVAEPVISAPTLQVDIPDPLTQLEAQLAARQAALNPHTPSKVLLGLAEQFPHEVALNPNAPFKVLLSLAGQFPREVAENPKFVEASQHIAEVLEKVREEDRPALFSHIVSYSGTSVNALLQLEELLPGQVLPNPRLKFAAWDSGTSIDVLLRLARYFPREVAKNTTFIKFSRRCPAILENMQESDRHLLLQQAAGNQNTSIELLVRLLGDFPKEVQGNLIFRNLLAEVPGLEQKMQALDLNQISYLGEIPEIFIEAIAKSQSQSLHKAFLDARSGYSWSHISQEAVIDIVPDVNVRRHLASSIDTSIEVLLKLATEFPQEVADNPMFMLLFLEDSSILQRMPYHDLAEASSRKNAPSIFLDAVMQYQNDNYDDDWYTVPGGFG